LNEEIRQGGKRRSLPVFTSAMPSSSSSSAAEEAAVAGEGRGGEIIFDQLNVYVMSALGLAKSDKTVRGKAVAGYSKEILTTTCSCNA
jgi:hypothetical protein